MSKHLVLTRVCGRVTPGAFCLDERREHLKISGGHYDSGPDEIIACPHCGGVVQRPTLISGNTFGAIFWTDGKMLAPMHPHLPAITRCVQCQQFYWLDDARVVGKLEYGKPVPDAWKKARRIRALTHDEFQAALWAGLATTAERERYWRVHYWWSGNDPLRGASAPRAPEYTSSVYATQYPVSVAGDDGQSLARAGHCRNIFDDS